ncbi:serine/threonine protein phosphatase [Paraliobacillus quinghaiensis]|uniref:Serine/threonine protein phosphatase n=1 Tax=Paraliobacillus quinghaiensis TaxID=470815 RepID=A0A917WVV1_9BACI|nr:metallophosphoesterase [Paraliobacillus quinghaiensis]GGM33277.1 serine/threonine protein phosphatase [Paraliobacillus quinghaiensis]
MKYFFLIILVAFLSGCNALEDNPKFIFKEIDATISENQDMTFFVTTDWHYLSESLTDNGEAFEDFIQSGDGKQLQDMDTIIDAFSYEVSNEQPSVLIISGDLTTNGERQSHVDIANKLKAIEDNGTTVYVIPGNHDINNPWARRFKSTHQYNVETINAEEFSEIYTDFGYDEAISEDPTSLSYLVAPSKDIWLLMIDTNQYDENLDKGSPEISGELSSHTLKWIEASFSLAEEQGATIIPVMHHNLATHNVALNNNYTLNNSNEIKALYSTYNVSLVLSGHIHAQNIHETKSIYDIATSSLAVYPQQYGVLDYDATNSTIEYNTKIVDVANWATKTNSNNPNLQHFDDHARTYFGEFAYDLAYSRLKNSTVLSKDEINYLSKSMVLLNQRFFAGTEELNKDDLFHDNRFERWYDVSDKFLKKYVESIVVDKNTDDNYIKLNLKK